MGISGGSRAPLFRVSKFCLALVAVLVADPAEGATLEIGFEGVVWSVSGDVPGGSVAAGTPFRGVLTYDPAAPPISSDPTESQYLLDAPPFGLRLLVAGTVYESDPADVQLAMTVLAALIDEETGEVFLPGDGGFDPDARLEPIDVLRAESASNLVVEGAGYELAFQHTLVFDRDPLDAPTLPDSADDYFRNEGSVASAAIHVLGTGASPFSLLGSVTEVRQIPEPSTAALLALGCALLAWQQRLRASRARGS